MLLLQASTSRVVRSVLVHAPPAASAAAMAMAERGTGNIVPTGSLELDVLLSGGLRAGEVTELVGPAGSLKTQVCAHTAAYTALVGGSVHFITSRADRIPQRLRDLLSAVARSVVAAARDPQLTDAKAAAMTATARIQYHRCFSLLQLHEVLTGLLAAPLRVRAAVALQVAAPGVSGPPGVAAGSATTDTASGGVLALCEGASAVDLPLSATKRLREVVSPPQNISHTGSGPARTDAMPSAWDGASVQSLRGGLVVVDSMHAIAAASVGSLRQPWPKPSAASSSSSALQASSLLPSARHSDAVHGQPDGPSSGRARPAAGLMSSALLEAVGRQLRQLARVAGCSVLVTNAAVPGGTPSSGELQPALGSAWYGIADSTVALWPASPASAGLFRGDGRSSREAARFPGDSSICDRSSRRVPLFTQQVCAARVRLLRAPRERFACMPSGSHTSVVAASGPAVVPAPVGIAGSGDDADHVTQPMCTKKRVDLAFRWCDTGLVMRDGTFDPPSSICDAMVARIVDAAQALKLDLTAFTGTRTMSSGPIGMSLVPDAASRAALAAQAAVQALMGRDDFGDVEEDSAAELLLAARDEPPNWLHMAGYAATTAALGNRSSYHADLVSTAARCGAAGAFLASSASQGWDVRDGELFVGGSTGASVTDVDI